MSRIVAMGGGAFVGEDHGRMHRYLLSLASTARPRVCFVATGKGDKPATVEAFYAAFRQLPCEASHLPLFEREHADLRAFVLTQDIVFVWGGNTASLLAVWRAHGLDAILRDAAREGVILAGACAGALAWFEDGITDSFGGLDPLRDGLGLIRGSLCPYANADPERPALHRRLIAAGQMQAGYRVDVGVALRFDEGELSDAVAQSPGLCATRVCANAGTLETEALTLRLLT